MSTPTVDRAPGPPSSEAPAAGRHTDEATTAEPIVRFDHVHKTFHTKLSDVHAVDDVSLTVESGEVFGVIGYSGAGKSTLVRLINALEMADEGEIVVNGVTVLSGDGRRISEKELRRLRGEIGMIFQQFNLFSAKTVEANVDYPLRLAGWPKEKRRTRALDLLDFVGLSDKAGAYPSQLSGGQKQRVGIARALAASPRLLLADEATSALDPETTRDVLDLLRRVNRELGVTIVLITHEMSVVRHICDRVAVMEGGHVVETGPVYDVFAHPRRGITRRFIQATLRDRPRRATAARLHDRHPGRLAIASIVDTGGETAVNLASVAAHQGLTTDVVHGSIGEVSGRPFGNVVVEIGSVGGNTGTVDEGAVEAFFAELRSLGSEVTDLGTADAPLDDPRWADTEPLTGDDGSLKSLLASRRPGAGEAGGDGLDEPPLEVSPTAPTSSSNGSSADISPTTDEEAGR
ncbi:MAG: ATP-binding cassette domain-containing protein [Propionibacteriaceae bacterium]|jgi:D-methionine transport system ATP-binding protein|nr:ATP-binding cassette domain-containing protein [Propionibacteriaceae bacterium]